MANKKENNEVEKKVTTKKSNVKNASSKIEKTDKATKNNKTEKTNKTTKTSKTTKTDKPAKANKTVNPKQTSKNSESKAVSKKTVKTVENSNKKLEEKPISNESKKIKPIVEIKETKNDIAQEKVEQVAKNNKILGIFEKVVILVAVALVFSILGYFIGNNHNKSSNNDVATKDLKVFIEQYNKIIEEYYIDVDKEALIRGAISGMLSTLDGYSQVIDDSSNNFTITLEGSYEGLGVEIINDSDGNIVVYNVYDDTPAKKAGLKVSDIITKLNDTDLKNISTKEFVNMISKLDSIKLTILRDKEEFTVELKKEKIILKSVYSEMLENSIGYIKVDLFANNTQIQFKEALESLEKENMKSLIIDLRNNTGGHLNTVKEMISLFLDSSHVIYQTQSKTETIKFYSNGNKNKNYNIVILQNEASASASEIMASALKEQLDAYIIGKKSFGKGTVQQLETVEGIGQYKFTTKKWLTSKGEWINGIGLTPDLEVSLDENYYKNPTKENDLQLQEAIKYLTKK